MMLKYLSKFVLDILPSVAATIIGAFVVTHYVNPQPKPDAPKAAVVSTTPPDAGEGKVVDVKAVDVKAFDVKAVADKPAISPAKLAADSTDRPVSARTPDAAELKLKPMASEAAEPKRHAIATREKDRTEKDKAEKDKADKEKAVAAVTPAAAVSPPMVAAIDTKAAEARPVPEIKPVVEDRRDVNDLARAAIERLRGSEPNRPLPETPRAAVQVALVPPLPPAVMVSTPKTPSYESPASPDGVKLHAMEASSREGFMPPVPPADIPLMQRPLNTQASIAVQDDSSANNDVFSAVKSIFRAVTPH